MFSDMVQVVLLNLWKVITTLEFVSSVKVLSLLFKKQTKRNAHKTPNHFHYRETSVGLPEVVNVTSCLTYH